MGIGNALMARRSSPAPSASLPLMGIGNRPRTGRPTTSSGTHYPSWGSGTRRPDGMTSRIVHSLPLMGIGNARKSPFNRPRSGSHLTTPHGDRELDTTLHRGRDALNLTTPHGDREPISPERLSIAMTRSLPLMGIGNQTTESTASVLSNSLPLMGIGNRSGGLAARRLRPLTTPHGDRERRRPPSLPRPESRSHYPSWGSGTLMDLSAALTFSDSLPLMGIGNLLIFR